MNDSGFVVCLCFAWMLMYPLLYGGQFGKTLLIDLMAKVMDVNNVKEGLILTLLAAPLLVAGTYCSLFGNIHRAEVQAAPPVRTKWRLISLSFLRFPVRDGTHSFELYSLCFILLPAVIFVISSMHRRLASPETSIEDVSGRIANIFGSVGMIAFSFFLVPVSKQGPITKALGWSHAKAVRLHIWCGRIIVWGSILHGLLHILRWQNVLNEDLLTMLIPPRECWESDAGTFQPQCVSPATDCTCHAMYTNFWGLIALMAVIILALTSLGIVRRRFYALFYSSHILAAPLVFIATILHYRRAFLYMVPSLLYYIATKLPTYFEKKYAHMNGGNRILSIERIANPANEQKAERPCFALTFEASDAKMRQYQPGMYINMNVPGISHVSHPFTVNAIPDKPNQLRIIFRVFGVFTNQLATRLNSLPLMLLDGFHGEPHLLQKSLGHDAVVCIAGGIGITPYLDLIYQIAKRVTSPSSKNRNCATKKVVLHWMCRDTSLVDYVQREYFDPLQTLISNAITRRHLDIQIIIHSTSSVFSLYSAQQRSASYSALPHSFVSNEVLYEFDESWPTGLAGRLGSPLEISSVTLGHSSTILHNLTPFLTFASIVWINLFMIIKIHASVPSESITARLYAPACVLIVSTFLAWVAGKFPNFSGKPIIADQQKSDHPEKRALITTSSTMMSHYDSSISDSQSSDETIESTVTIEHKNGKRPAVHELLRCMYGTVNPGVFCCGPTELINDIRLQSKQGVMRSKKKRKPDSVTIYDEAFIF